MSSPLNIRTFIAVRLPPAVLQALGEVSEQVAREWPEKSVRWVRPENMHLTLRFLAWIQLSITIFDLGYGVCFLTPYFIR